MSQNMINDLTDRVSALTADVARLRAAVQAEATSGQIHFEARERLTDALREAIEAARLFNRSGMTWLEYDGLLARLEHEHLGASADTFVGVVLDHGGIPADFPFCYRTSEPVKPFDRVQAPVGYANVPVYGTVTIVHDSKPNVPVPIKRLYKVLP